MNKKKQRWKAHRQLHKQVSKTHSNEQAIKANKQNTIKVCKLKGNKEAKIFK